MPKSLSINNKFLIRQQLRIQKHEISRKLIRKKNRRLKQIANLRKNRRESFLKNPAQAKKIIHKFPRDFSLLDDPSKVIKFFSNAKKDIIRGFPVAFDLSDIENMGSETIAFALALFNEPKFLLDMPIRGNIPSKKQLKDMFESIGFWDHVQADDLRAPSPSPNEDNLNKLLHQVKKTKVEPVLATAEVQSAIKYTLNDTSVSLTFKNLRVILIECMGNTHNHANFGEKEEYNWWILAYKEPITKITKFCFLDLGVGIFGSLKAKHQKNMLERLFRMFVEGDNVETIKKIFQGERTTSSDKLGRGLGLRNIYLRVKSEKHINNFTIISNNVIAKIGYNIQDNIELLDCDFEGTLFYWEFTP